MRKELTIVVPLGIVLTASALASKQMKKANKGMRRYTRKMKRAFF